MYNTIPNQLTGEDRCSTAFVADISDQHQRFCIVPQSSISRVIITLAEVDTSQQSSISTVVNNLSPKRTIEP
eukprot:CCRYP_004385-RA/>CCRYP_004385-RA protein AED:0.35 eAED:0.35 QI:0/0/0.5/1/0/0/2/2285/71